MPKDTRATQDLVRKALFDILGQDLSGVSFLELFAGSGSVGLEAMSRGAEKVVFVEHDPRAAEIIDENLQRLNPSSAEGYDDSFHVFTGDVFIMVKQLAHMKKKFDIVFADPPYGLDLAKKALNLISGYDIVHADSIVVIQHEKREALPEQEGGLKMTKQRKYGNTFLTFYSISHTS